MYIFLNFPLDVKIKVESKDMHFRNYTYGSSHFILHFVHHRKYTRLLSSLPSNIKKIIFPITILSFFSSVFALWLIEINLDFVNLSHVVQVHSRHLDFI